jgi:hypothetical protein
VTQVQDVLFAVLLHLLMGFVLALPFAFIRNYIWRLVFGISVPLAVLYILLYLAHLRWTYDCYICYFFALVCISGALLAVHLRNIWKLVRGPPRN